MIVNINCVYGIDHVDTIKNCMIPSLLQYDNPGIQLNLLSYDPRFSGNFENYMSGKITTKEYAPLQRVGFGEAHNILAEQIETDSFIIVNPDCFFFKNTVSNMMDSWKSASEDVGIIEGRQWPFSHPKSYNKKTFNTHWSSGAYCLFDTDKFKKLRGYDTDYFMYLEDVDLSWRMWLSGYSVKHEPSSVVAHFTGFNHYKADRLSLESYYSYRNHILITRKFFGHDAEIREMKRLALSVGASLYERITVDISKNFESVICNFNPKACLEHEMIILNGIGVYHE